MRKFYEKNPVWFAVILIVLYCVVNAPIKGNYGMGSVQLLLTMAAFALGITLFVKIFHVEKKHGLTSWPKNTARYLYFIPMWILSTGNLWDGFPLVFNSIKQLYGVLTMLLIGFVEEMLFRGFLFNGLKEEEGTTKAIIISAITFGIGHLVNLFSGQATFHTLLQVFFAIAWGFIFTMVYHKCGCLWPCIIGHGLIDAFSIISQDTGKADMRFMIATIVGSIAYSLYLNNLKPKSGKIE